MKTKSYPKPISEELAELIGFGTHMYRHYYRAKLSEMHLDDFTIAKLLGHSSVENVKYYRKMSSQILADETVERGPVRNYHAYLYPPQAGKSNSQ